MGNRNLRSIQKRIPAGTRRGFTLIETLVAISVFMLAIIGPLTIIRLALSTAAVSKDQVSAFYLAQDAIEYVVNLRNSNSKNGNPWLSGIDTDCIDDECTIDTNEADPAVAIQSDVGDCDPLRYDPVSQRYGCDSSWEESPFTRTIRLEEVEPNTEMVLVVTIAWRSGSFDRTLVIPQSLFNIADAIVVAAGGASGGGGGGGSITDPTCSLWPGSQSITTGGTAYLSWSTTNASVVTFSPSLGGTSPSTNELNRAVTPSVTTTYEMTANGAGVPATCQAIVTVGAAADTTAPTAPSNLAASAVSSSQINLSWTASSDLVGVTGYQVERCQGNSCTSFAQIGTPSTNSYQNTSLSANTLYRYRVRAVDAAGNLSNYSSIAQATTQSASTASLTVNKTSVATGGTVRVNFSGAPGNATDWIGVYVVGDSNTSEYDYQYINGETSGFRNFTMDYDADNYNFRLFSNDSYTLLATSPTVTVTD